MLFPRNIARHTLSAFIFLLVLEEMYESSTSVSVASLLLDSFAEDSSLAEDEDEDIFLDFFPFLARVGSSLSELTVRLAPAM